MQTPGPMWLLEKVVLLPPLLLSLAAHELAHARTALAFGDPTARNLGRCSLNPLVHLDPIGTLSIMLVGFGWAKPVPVNPHNLHPRRWADIAVSFAGPLSNLLIAILIALGLRAALTLGATFASRAGEMAWTLSIQVMGINLCLFLFNLLPLYPLDGHHIAREQLPRELQGPFMEWQMRYGVLVLLAILVAPTMAGAAGMHFAGPVSWMTNHAVDAVLQHVVLPSGWSVN